jgi:hypothetical protein
MAKEKILPTNQNSTKKKTLSKVPKVNEKKSVRIELPGVKERLEKDKLSLKVIGNRLNDLISKRI